MEYITEIKAFYDLVMTKQLSTGQIALWHALMYINNKCAWITWFSVPNQMLEFLTGNSRQAVLKNRNILKQNGLIDFRTNGTKATDYMLKSLQVSFQDGCQNSCHSGCQDGCQNSCILNIQDNTRQDITPYIPPKEKIPFQEIIEAYGRICVSFPKVTKLSDARRKAIKARFNSGYGMEDFARLFEMAEDSKFLKGENNRNWSATFDWLIADKNMAKVLDGNYTNKSEFAPTAPQQEFTDWGAAYD